MFQDRRRHPRFPTLLKAVAVSERDRYDVVCTNVGPAGAFFTARNLPQAQDKLTIEVRASGLGSAQVELESVVARVVPPGSSWPAGFAVTWTVARCTLGAEPLVKVLRDVLKIQDLALQELGNTERLATLDIAAWLAGVRRPPSQTIVAAPVGRESSTVIRRVQGNWSPPPIGSASSSRSSVPMSPPRAPAPTPEPQGVRSHVQASAPAVPPTVVAPPPLPRRSHPTVSEATSQPGQADSQVRPVPAVVVAPRVVPVSGSSGMAPAAGPVQAPGAVRTPGSSAWSAPSFQPRREDVDPLGFDTLADKTPIDGLAEESSTPGAEGSGIFDPLAVEPSQAIGRRQGTGPGSLTNEGPSQSWPVYALAPGERRQVTRSGATSPGATPEDILSTIRPLPRTAPREGIRQSSVQQAEVVRPLHRPASMPISTVSGPTPLPGEKSAVHRSDSDSKVMRSTQIPVTFVRKNQFIPGHIVSIAQQAVAIVTEDQPPELDEPLVVNMPVLIEGVYRTIYLSGKLLQVAQDTDQGRRFVMHIERVDEGKWRGAFKNFLTELQA